MPKLTKLINHSIMIINDPIFY